MQILIFFLLICFTNFCNSFGLINKKYCPTFISRHCSHTLNMGCDYYVDKELNIYDNNNRIVSHINLEHEKGYYWFISTLDKDEADYDKQITTYIKETLEPKMEPIMIYSNHTFNKSSFENKYKTTIEYELNLINKTWNDVNQIIKVEKRYER